MIRTPLDLRKIAAQLREWDFTLHASIMTFAAKTPDYETLGAFKQLCETRNSQIQRIVGYLSRNVTRPIEPLAAKEEAINTTDTVLQ